MASIKKDNRTNQVLLVIQRSNQGISISEACQAVGISRSTFYYFTSHNPDVIATYQEMQLAAEMAQFALILDSQFEVLARVIQDGLAEPINPRQRLTIIKHLNKRMDELSRRTKSCHSQDDAEADFLIGPALEPGISSFQRSELLIPDVGVEEA